MPSWWKSSAHCFTLAATVFCAHASVATLNAQSTRATASRSADLQAGGYYVYGDSDYAPQSFGGFGGYATFDFKPHWGIEANVRQINTSGNNNVYERTYEVGGRYVLHKDRFNPYARLSVGRGVFNFPQNRANLAYNLFSFGAGLDYNLMKAINVRGDYEFQNWLSFPSSGKSLSPQLISVGVAYHFH